ncbi:hypothetical protein CKO11_11295 [Rhodobacter sp. TJ_12]|uniref:DUF6477 family protein n=1 Tax=Rhodobacter sp. TJ_12 TaxID=2029399 RepID=UPI001CBCAABD|nr:DUF6477 family protein [Rhodobacter sp. TJ_12]MBZ4023045.1 hypothetical protein [Rhodobacter sp. TJ_12]
MTDPTGPLAHLRRPKLLIRAARCGLHDYDRRRALKRLLATAVPPAPDAAVQALLASESKLEEARRKGTAAYSFPRHVEVLIALMAEVRLSTPPAPPPSAP